MKVTAEQLLAEAADLIAELADEINPEDGHDRNSFDLLIARLEIIKQTVITAKYVEYVG